MNESVKMRVELIKNPELEGLTKYDVDKFRADYENYKEKVNSQNDNAKPVSKYTCIPKQLRRSICNQMGINPKQVTQQIVFQKLDAISNQPISIKSVDATTVFRGVRMEAPKRKSEIDKKIQKYFLKIDERIEMNGVEDELHDINKLEFRKNAFPNIINGVWPSTLSITLQKEWKNESKRWTLHQLLTTIEKRVKNIVDYELDRLELIRTEQKKNEKLKKTTTFSKSDQKFSAVNRTSGKTRQQVTTNNSNSSSSSTGKRIRCFNCGIPGHKKPECKMAYNDPKAVAGRKSLMNVNTKRLKRLQEINEQLLREPEDLKHFEDQEDKENYQSTEEEDVLDYESSDLNYSSTNDQ